MTNDDVRAYFDSDYIGAWDLNGKDCTVTIDKVVAGELTSKGNRKTRKPIVYFRGAKKGLAVNKTNLKIIAGMYGFKAKDWSGKRITLYPTKTQFGPDEVDCVRVRPGIPRGNTKDAPPTPDPESERDPGADDVAPDDEAAS